MTMKKISDLKPGEILDNKELISIFQCSPQGGMRKSNRTNSLVIVSNHVESIYGDRWEGDVLYYTGMGTKENQSFDFMQNKTLYHSESNNVAVHLFEVFTDKQYTYIGKVALAEKPFWEEQPDREDNIRKVCIFPVKVIDNKIPPIEKKKLEKNIATKRRRIKKLDNKTLLKLAKRGSRTPETRNINTVQYVRNESVAELAKRIAKGICQLCGEIIPFNDKDGSPYLETHHIDWLSEGGSDTIENTAALCPNCHAKMHVVDDKEDREYLKNLIKNIISNIDIEQI